MKLVVASVLGLLTAAGISLGVVSSQAPADLTPASSILDVYGTR